MIDLIDAQIRKYPFLRNYFYPPGKEKQYDRAKERVLSAPLDAPQRVAVTGAKYEDQFTVFIDFLGFEEASNELKREARQGSDTFARTGVAPR
jgi:hypothetical protein